MSQENSSLDPEAKQLSFEKTRYDYSIKMFENEASRKKDLETKAQFYLTFVTAFLAAIYLSLPYLTTLQGFMHNNSIDQTWRIAITVLLVGLGVGLLFSLLAVLFAMKIQEYRAEYPLIPYPALFSPKNYEENNEAELLKYTAQEAIRALQKNKDYNDRKAQYVKGASFGILFAVLMLTLLVGISVYLQVYVVLPTPPKP
jgi:hypothetical protein